MSFYIEDGKGSGKKAEVDSHGRLFTRANIIGHMSHHSTYHKNAFSIECETTLADSNWAHVAHLKNEYSDKDLEIYWFKLNADTNMEMALCTGTTYTSGGTEVTPVNLNIESGLVSSVSVYEGGASDNMVVDTTSEVIIEPFFIGAYNPYIFSFDGGIVIPPKKSICVKAKGSAANRLSVFIGYSLHNANEQL